MEPPARHAVLAALVCFLLPLQAAGIWKGWMVCYVNKGFSLPKVALTKMNFMDGMKATVVLVSFHRHHAH